MIPLGTPIFTFLFTREADVLESARVVAETRDAAWAMVSAAIGTKPPLGAIVSVTGRFDGDARFLSVIRRKDGAQLVDSDGALAA